MLFNTWTFLIFLPIFAVAYFASSGRLRLWVMLAGSLVFYAWWDWRFLFLLLFSAGLDFTLGILLENETDPVRRKRLVTLSVAVNLGLLGFFKYFNFFVASAVHVSNALGMRATYDALRIVLPVGISFYVFKTMSYTVDVYKRTQAAERDLLRFTTFVVFFPELVAGPIVRASRMLPQMKRDHRFNYARTLAGLTLIASGYVRKVVIAGSLAPLVDMRFAVPSAHSAMSLLLGVYFYAFQIYCDFSGYSNIAIGLARIFGFDFGINFDRPYWSQSFSEFWTRWHISLSSWLRDYLYIPLGGNRGGTWKTTRNLMLTMLLGGLWHGANWTFVAWGGLHGLYLVLQRIISPAYQRTIAALRIPKLVSALLLIFVVFHLTCLGWIFFRAETFARAWEIIRGIASMNDLSLASVPQKFLVVKALLLVGGLTVFEALTFLPKTRRPVLAAKPDEKVGAPPHPPVRTAAVRLAFVAACTWIVLVFGTFSGNTFIYFQF